MITAKRQVCSLLMILASEIANCPSYMKVVYRIHPGQVLSKLRLVIYLVLRWNEPLSRHIGIIPEADTLIDVIATSCDDYEKRVRLKKAGYYLPWPWFPGCHVPVNYNRV